MSVKIIDTLKPKNNGSFPIVEAVDVSVAADLRLPEALEAKADVSALVETQAAVELKADASSVETATANLQGQINQIEISATAEAVVAPEVAAARVGSDGTEYSTLKERADADDNAHTAAETTISENISNLGVKLRDDSSVLIQYGYINSTGQFKEATDPYHYYTDYIPITNVSSLLVNTLLRYAYIAWYTKDQEFISSVSDDYTQSVVEYELTPPDGAAYIRISCYNSNHANDSFFVQYIYDIADDISGLKDDVSGLSESVEILESGITPEMTTFISGGSIDPNGNIALEDEYTKNAYLNNGNIVSNQYTELYCCTGYIEVEPNTDYVAVGFEDNNTDDTYAVAQYATDKTYISTFSTNWQFTTAANCKYIIVCLRGGTTCPDIGTGILVVKKGTTMPDSYEPPKYTPVELAGSDYVSKSESETVTPEMTTFISGGEFDITGNICTEENYTKDAYIQPNGEVVHNAYTSRYCVTDYMEVVPNKQYITQVYDNNHSRAYCIAQYAADKSFIKSDTSTGSITTDQTCKYVRASYIGDICPDIGTGIIVFKQGTVAPDEYEAPRNTPLELEGSNYVTEDEISGLITESAVKLTLPDKFELVVGDKFELFWKGAINCLNPDDYYVEVTCAKGIPFRRNYEFTPAVGDIGTYTMSVELYDQDRKLLDSKSVSLIVKAAASNPGTEKVVCYVGDSLAQNGYVPDELHRRIVTVGGCTNLTFIGNTESVANSVRYIGNGGWTWSSYLSPMKSNAYMWVTASHDKTADDQHSIYSDGTNEWKLETIESGRIKIIRSSGSGALPSSGTLTWVSGGEHHSNIVYSASEQAAGNPFWNDDENKFDIESFVESQGKSTLDYMYILLGWNSTTATTASIKSDVQAFVNAVHDEYPDCEIIILGLEVPAFDGLAANYGANSGTLSSFYKSMGHVWRLNELYAEIAIENENVSFVNVACQFDTEYNMLTAQRNVNARNATKITYQRNGVHPDVSGYYQIADACYRDFTHKLQS